MANIFEYSGEGINENPIFDFEADYWGNCCNTLFEDLKQYLYAKLMQIERSRKYPLHFEIKDKKILDIGGGPSSILLKCFDHGPSKVVDPLQYPKWTIERYKSNKIEVDIKKGEDIEDVGYDEVWIYNCLQHVENPEQIIKNAKKAAPVLRIFEWIDIPAHAGHPHELKQHLLDQWIGQRGNIGNIVYNEFNELLGINQPRLIPDQGPGTKDRCYFGKFEFL